MTARTMVSSLVLLLLITPAFAAQQAADSQSTSGAAADANSPSNSGGPADANAATHAAPLHSDEKSISINADDPEDPWVPGTNRWGARGMWLVDSAHAARRNSLVFAISHEMSITNNIFPYNFPGDYDFFQTQRLYIMWSPITGLELGLSEGLVTNVYRTFVQHTIQALGSPTLNVKYSLPIIEDLGVGVLGTFLVPSAIHSNGLVPRAFTASIVALGTYEVARWLELTLNIGYVIDQSSKLASSVQPDQRFAFNISNYNGVSYGVGAIGRIDIADVVGLGPFGEVTGRFDQGISAGSNPVQASLGLKAYWLQNHFVELVVGANIRLDGAPSATVLEPGLPPWGFFAQVSLHLFDHPEPKTVLIGNAPCNADTDCGQGQTCHDHICVITERVVELKEIKQESFTISGKVLDAQTLRPVLDSVVTISGFEQTPLQVDYKTGAYHSFPIPTGDGLIQIKATAPNYKANEQTVARGKPNEDKTLLINMLRDDRPAMGKLRGSLKDGRTGKPVPHGTIFVIALQQKIQADEKGNFSADVKAGRYDVLVSAPKYATQRKKLIIRDADVIILNVDMRHGKAGVE